MLTDSYEFHYLDNFLHDGHSKSNACVRKLTADKSAGDWRGPVLVVKVAGSDFNAIDTPRYVDIQLKDMPDMIDFLTGYGKQGLQW